MNLRKLIQLEVIKTTNAPNPHGIKVLGSVQSAHHTKLMKIFLEKATGSITSLKTQQHRTQQVRKHDSVPVSSWYPCPACLKPAHLSPIPLLLFT